MNIHLLDQLREMLEAGKLSDAKGAALAFPTFFRDDPWSVIEGIQILATEYERNINFYCVETGVGVIFCQTGNIELEAVGLLISDVVWTRTNAVLREKDYRFVREICALALCHADVFVTEIGGGK